MKKMNVNIASPCHENWDAMTNADKGRFCASCQKTVVDFTDMSDREIIEYFTKSTGSVCGRLTDEQLSKDLVIPPEPIPWVKYIFKITFPAFIMSLKSCIIPNNDAKQNKTKSSLSKSQEDQNTYIMGALIRQKNTIPKVLYTTPNVKSDTTVVTTEIELESTKCPGSVLGDVEIVTDTSIIRVNKQKPENDFFKNEEVTIEPIPLMDSFQFQPIIAQQTGDYPNLDTVFVKCNIMGNRIRLGGASAISIKVSSKPIDVIKKVIDTINIFSTSPKFQLYPNPVTSSSRLNIKLSNISEGEYLLSVINLNGVIVQNQEIRIDDETNVVNFDLKSLLAGTYIVRLVNRSNSKSITQKLVVL